MVFHKYVVANKVIRFKNRAMTRKIPCSKLDETVWASLNVVLFHSVEVESKKKPLVPYSFIPYRASYQETTNIQSKTSV